MRHWRIMTWVILAFNILMLCWLIFGVGGAANDANCAGEATKDLQNACQAGTAIGAGIGAALIIALWVAGDIILGVIWLITNRGKRDCPGCGRPAKKGVTVCKSCGYDFRLGRAPEDAPGQAG